MSLEMENNESSGQTIGAVEIDMLRGKKVVIKLPTRWKTMYRCYLIGTNSER